MLAIWHSFIVFRTYFESKRGNVIIWLTDSMCCYSFLKVGSRIPHIQKLLIDIKIEEYRFGITLYPKWVSRDDGPLKLADAGSRLSASTDEYGVSHGDFMLVQSFFQLVVTVDAMAAFNNRKTQVYFSVAPQVESSGLNFFYQELLSNEVYYIHPPVNCISKVIQRIVQYPDITCILVIPVWISHPYWTTFADAGFFKSFVKNVFVHNPLYLSKNNNSMFSGYKTFPTFFLHIATKEHNQILIPEF